MKQSVIHVEPLPGCEPYDNCRTMRVRHSHDGLTLIDFLQRLHPPTPLDQWRAWIHCGKIMLHERGAGTGGVGTDCPVQANQIVSAGQCYHHHMPGTVEPRVANRIGVVYRDDCLLVVNKPAPLPVHPSGRFSRNTLSELLRTHYREPNLRIAHRLDANTTGLVLFCRTRAAAGFVQPQFERREVSKEYVALVHGTVPWDQHQCHLPIGRAAELGGCRDTSGARIVHPDGQAAETRFEVMRRIVCQTDNDSGTTASKTLVRAIPITGRTNQIRVHLWALGFPIMGDPLYLASERPGEQPSKSLGKQQTLAVGEPPMCLHARQLTITHPETRQPITFQQPAAFEDECSS